MKLAPADRDVIAWYVDEVMIELSKRPNKASPHGYGTLTVVGTRFLEWGKKYGHTFWSTEKGVSTNAMAQRVKVWCSNGSVNSFNKADAEWIAETIRMKFDDAGTTHVQVPTPTELIESFKVGTTEDNHAYVEPLLSVAEIKRDITLDGIREMAQEMRKFVKDVHDKELTDIMADAELKLLRLLADRL